VKDAYHRIRDVRSSGRDDSHDDSSSATLSEQAGLVLPTDEELDEYFTALAVPPKKAAKLRLMRLLPALAKARTNGNSVKFLADQLRAKGVDVSAVTLRKHLDTYVQSQEA